MTRRTPISKRVIHLLQERSTVGSGQDMTAPTPMGDTAGVVTAYAARIHGPSQHMRTVVDRLAHWLTRMGATSVFIETDRRHLGHPGCLTVHWNGPIPAAAAACQVAVAFRDGLPVIPGWLSLVAEDDWDLRWQTPFGPLAPPMNPAQDALIHGSTPAAPPAPAAPSTKTPGRGETVRNTTRSQGRTPGKNTTAGRRVSPKAKLASPRKATSGAKGTPKQPEKPHKNEKPNKKVTPPAKKASPRKRATRRPSPKPARPAPQNPPKRTRSRSASGR